MRIVSATLRQFRNIAHADLEFSPQFTALIGPNGQGKTNALEALYLLSALRPLRNVKRRALIRHDEELAEVDGIARSERTGLDHRLQLRIQGNQRTLIKDDKRCEASSFLGLATAVVFTPDDLQLAKGGPDSRRKFLDRGLLNLRPAYLDHAMRYAKAVRERNRLLLERASDDIIDAYDQVVAKEGASIAVRRHAYTEELKDLIVEHFERISNPAPKLTLHYRCSLGDQLVAASEAETEEAFLMALGAGRERDRRKKTTGVGPHLDDLVFLFDGQPAKERASQGQHRALLLAIKLAELIHLTESLGEPPLLMLDDMSSELDRERSGQLFEAVAQLEGQVILTSTEEPSALRALLDRQASDVTVYRVDSGTLSRDS